VASLADRFGSALAFWVAGVLRWRKLTIAASLLATGLAAYYAAGHLGVNTDTANMISPTLEWRRHFIEYRDAFPVRDRNLLIVIDAPSAARADAFSAALLAELRKRPDLYHSILLQGEGEFFERNGLLYLPLAELEQLADRLAAAQPLLGLLKSRFDGAAVLDVATRTLEPRPEAAAGAGGDADAAVTPFYAALAATLKSARAGDPQPLAWRSLLVGGAPPATRKLIVLQPELDFSRMQPATVALAGIREIAAELNASEPTPVTVRLTGTVAMEHEELLSVSQGAALGSIATMVLVAIVLYASLRSWRFLVISIVTLLCGLSLTAAFAAVTVGHLNLLSIAFVVLNVGLGSDYVIHVLLRHKELLAEGHSTDSALLETMRGVGSSLALCAVTTAAGFYSFIPTTFQGVSELGLIAGTGVFFGLFASVTLLPALVAQLAPKGERETARTLIDPKIFVPLQRRPRVVLGLTAVILVASFAVLPRVTFDSNPIHLRNPRSESVSTLLELAATGDAPLLNLDAVAPDDATAQRWAAELRKLPEVRSVVTVGNLVPGEQQEKLAVLDDLGLLLGSSFGDVDAVPAAPEAMQRALEELTQSSGAVPAAAGLHAEAAALEAALAADSPPDRQRRLTALDAALTAGLPAELHRLAAGLSAKPFDRGALPAALAERWLASGGRELVEIVPAEDVSDNAAARRFIGAVHGVVPNATGLPVVYDEASRTVVHAFELAFLYALLMVSAIILVVLHDLKDVLLIMAPIVLAAVVTLGATVLISMPLNYANIIALPLLVGLGVDNGIHVVHRMRTDSVAQLFDTSTMRAVLASALTTVASFGNLAFSSHVGTASMGVLLALGLAISMAATLIVLPAWLNRRARALPAH
jgi:hopanoid biosynthesis associated RND transporter like protein HpnN